MESMHDRMMSGVPCYHCPWTTPTIKRRQARHARMGLGKHPLSDYVGRGMPSSPLDSTYGGMTLGVECNHRPWTTYTVRVRRAWHTIMDLGNAIIAL